jgi:hypothetical protein
MSDDAYQPGSPKRSDYSGPSLCVWCCAVGGHTANCPEVQR